MADLVGVVQTLLYGLINGSVIAVGAVGLTLSYGVTRFINFAYGELLTLGAYTAFLLVGVGLGLPVATVVALLAVGVGGVLVARAFYDPLSDRGPLPLLITSIGVAFILRNLVRAFAGTEARQLPVPLMRPWVVAGLRLNPVDAGVMVAAVVTMLSVHLLLQRTMLGKKMRATSGNEQLARVAGIDTDAVVRRTWFISSVAGAVAGVLLAIQFPPFRPTMGWDFLIVVFSATLLGGIGKPYGAMVGSLVVGVAMSVGTRYVATEYTMAYAFGILVLVLLFKPEGIAGGEI
ncbi:MAG: branched-chain amino acid ABC transporter permease [Haloferacaceae archaeon]